MTSSMNTDPSLSVAFLSNHNIIPPRLQNFSPELIRIALIALLPHGRGIVVILRSVTTVLYNICNTQAETYHVSFL